jgi:hypothetical protein
MYDRYPDRLPEPPPPRRRAPLSRILSGLTFTSIRLLGMGFFLFTGLALVLPFGVFLWRAIDLDEPPRVPHAERVGHAHGLAVDSGDGALYVMTSRGMFWIKSPEWAERVGGDSYQDSRGLIAVSPGEFLAGGRPDLRDRVSGFAPQYSGLIRSRDAGKTWRAVSLAGVADFQVLEAKGGAIYGFDAVSGGFMVSQDAGKTWETRSTPDALLDFAVNPGNANQIYGVTLDSVIQSTDGGRTWRAQDPIKLRHLVWPDQNQLWGVDEAGGVHFSADAGLTWQLQGALAGPAEAFHATSVTLYAAVHDDATGTVIYVSHDGGKTWQERYRDPSLTPS